MTPEPSNEYQKLVEAVKAALDADLCRQSLVQGTKYVADTETGLRDANMYIALDELALSALSALKLPHAGDDGWQDIAELKPKFGEVLGWADGCGYEVVRCHSDGHRYAGSFTADWVTHWRPLPTPPAKGTPHV